MGPAMEEDVAQADQAAQRAARRAGVAVKSLTRNEEIGSLVGLLTEIWQPHDEGPLITQALTRALVHAGNYVSGAFVHDRLVGASVGFYGFEEGNLFLHSHITGVAAWLQGRSVGFALKQHQRAWALRRDLDSITWTFDPLVRRNAYFNVTKLGAEIVDYKPDFYGAMDDEINREDTTDRCVVLWRLDSERASEAAAGRAEEPLVDESAAVILSQGDGGEPRLSLEAAPVLLASIPNDIVQVRRDQPERAAAWRTALRDASEWAFREGYAITGMTRAGSYVFTR